MNKSENGRRKAILTRKNVLAAAFSLILVAVIFGGASFALLKMNTGAVVNSFRKGGIGVDIVETVSNSAKKEITVKNTGESPAYVRVRLVSYWKDDSGNVAPKASKDISFDLNDADWKENNGYYYYRKPLAGESTTSNLIADNSKIEMTTEDGYKQVIEVLAEVVQATPAEAVKDVWGIENASQFFS